MPAMTQYPNVPFFFQVDRKSSSFLTIRQLLSLYQIGQAKIFHFPLSIWPRTPIKINSHISVFEEIFRSNFSKKLNPIFEMDQGGMVSFLKITPPILMVVRSGIFTPTHVVFCVFCNYSISGRPYTQANICAFWPLYPKGKTLMDKSIYCAYP